MLFHALSAFLRLRPVYHSPSSPKTIKTLGLLIACPVTTKTLVFEGLKAQITSMEIPQTIPVWILEIPSGNEKKHAIEDSPFIHPDYICIYIFKTSYSL